MVKILYLIVWETFDQSKVVVYMFSLIYICLDFHEKYVFHKPLCIVSEVQYICQWLHYDNLWKIRTCWEPYQPELWKPTLKL